jgi:Cu2+-exporting ATPase/Cu+-exporting ATPase
MAAEAPQLIYFVSGMWCSTCAKNIRESVAKIDGVGFADLNYASKLLLVQPKAPASGEPLDLTIRNKVERIGFGIKRQPEGWVLQYHEHLKNESSRKIPWTLISLVWFLAMWSSMLAFAGYLGGDLSDENLYWLTAASSAFGLPAILAGIVPFGRAGLRAIWFSRLPTLDLFIFLGGISAAAVSALSLLSSSHVTYADSGSMIVAILLLAKKIESGVAASVTSDILFQLHPSKKSVSVFRRGQWVPAEIAQVKRGDLTRVAAGETVPFDGCLEGDSGGINNHLMSGESRPVPLKKGDHIFAGAIALDELELSVLAPQGERKIDAWAEAALLSESGKSKYNRRFARMESALVTFAFCGALSLAALQALKGAAPRSIAESFFVGILVFCPCLFASIIPLMKQMAHLALLKRGVAVSRADALLDLSRIKNFYFDKTGTLEAVESAFIPLGEDGGAALPYLNAVAAKSNHPLMRGLRCEGESKALAEIKEYPGLGLEAVAADGTKIAVGRPAFLQMGEDSAHTLVSAGGRIVGRILAKSVYDEDSRVFLRKLLELVPGARAEILSGDPSPEAGASFKNLGPGISYSGNLSPEQKAERIASSSVFTGDGLNDTLALAKARVGFRLGHRILGFAPVDFHLRTPDLNLILATIRYARKFRRVLVQTAAAAFLYNISAFALAAAGKFSPLGAVLSMLASFSVMLLSVSRLAQIPGDKK